MTTKQIKNVARYTAGDTGPPLQMEYLDAAGVAVDVSGWTITLHLRRPSPATVLTKAMTITDGPNGLFEVTVWASGDLLEGADQLAEVQLVDTGGVIITTQKMHIDVDSEIA